MTVRITEAELARDIHAVPAKVQEGVEVIVEQDHRPLAVIKTPQGPGRKMEHGYYGANTAELKRKRRDYLDAVLAAIPVEPFTKDMAQTPARINGEAKRAGRVIPFPELRIGATALQLGHAVGTRNLRHFRMIPGPDVIQL
jgi:hypothetical protein